MTVRKLKVKATQRNVNRVIKWLGLECSMTGFFTSEKYEGYKTCGNKEMIFNIKVK